VHHSTKEIMIDGSRYEPRGTEGLSNVSVNGAEWVSGG
jgi:hypothetical protein